MEMRSVIQMIGLAAGLLCLGILAPSSSHADIYAWTDADGVRHFANKPPPGDVNAVWLRQEIRSPAAEDRRIQTDDMRGRSRSGDRRAQVDTPRGRRTQASSGGRRMAASLPEQPYRKTPRRDRGVRSRADQREHGTSSGLTRVVRAIPSPYYMGYRPVYSRSRSDRSNGERRDGRSYNRTRVVRAIPSPYYMGYRPVYSRSSSYRSSEGGRGGRSYNRGGGSRRAGGRARAGF